MQFSLALVLVLAVASGERLRARKDEPMGVTGAFDVSCYETKDIGLSYRGLVSSTFSGRTCQKWTDQKPWTISITFTDENGLGDHNYCRNPDSSEEMPWCYTMDTNLEHKKETCGIPECGRPRRFSHLYADCDLEGDGDCDCADQLYGSAATTRKTQVALTLVQAHGNKTAEHIMRCLATKAARKSAKNATSATNSTRATNATAAAKNSCTAKVQNPASDLVIGIPNVVHDEVEFCSAGQLKVQEGSCPVSGHALPDAKLVTNGGQSACQTVKCDAYPCCMAFKCGGTISWER